MSEIKHHAGAANTVRLTYGYDARAKINDIDDHVVASSDRTFSYDAIGRLAGATSEDWGTASYKYDALNNIRDRDIGSRTVDIAYNGNNQVSSVTDTANPYRAFAHDDRGNVTNDGRYTFVYDHADQPTSVSDTGGTLATYTYDGNKKRVKQVVDGKTSYFVYSAVTGGLIFKDDVTDTKATDYASIGPASVRIENGSTPVYTHADHLGSPVAATDASGTLLWRESYLPFGEKLLSPASNADNTGYTGHVEDAITGLTYMQARYFDPVIGRFYSTDPVDYYDQLNLYAYGPNDPVNGTDPNGMVWGKIARFGGKVLKYKGDVKRAGKETITEIGSAVKTFGDGKLDLNDAAAAFDLVSPISLKEVKAAGRSARRAGSRIRQRSDSNKGGKGDSANLSSSGSGKPPGQWSTGQPTAGPVTNGISNGGIVGAVGGGLTGGVTGYEYGGIEGAIIGTVAGVLSGGVVGALAGGVAGAGAPIAGGIGGATAGFGAQRTARSLLEEDQPND